MKILFGIIMLLVNYSVVSKKSISLLFYGL